MTRRRTPPDPLEALAWGFVVCVGLGQVLELEEAQFLRVARESWRVGIRQSDDAKNALTRVVRGCARIDRQDRPQSSNGVQ